MARMLFESRGLRPVQVTVCGSFNRNMAEVAGVIKTLKHRGIGILSPKEPEEAGEPWPGFKLLASDAQSCIRFIEDCHLAACGASDVVVLVTTPDPVLGNASAGELGACYTKGVPVVATGWPLAATQGETLRMRALLSGVEPDANRLARAWQHCWRPNYGLPLLLQPAERLETAGEVLKAFWRHFRFTAGGLNPRLIPVLARAWYLLGRMAEGAELSTPFGVLARLEGAATRLLRPERITTTREAAALSGVSGDLEDFLALARHLPLPA